MAALSPGERVLGAFRHEEPDRTPFGEIWMVQPPTADVVLGRPCLDLAQRMAYLVEGNWQGLVDRQVSETVDLVKALGWDFVTLSPNLPRDCGRPVQVAENVWKTADSVTRRRHLLGSGDALTRYCPESGMKDYALLEPKTPEQLEAEMPFEIEADHSIWPRSAVF